MTSTFLSSLGRTHPPFSGEERERELSSVLRLPPPLLSLCCRGITGLWRRQAEAEGGGREGEDDL